MDNRASANASWDEALLGLELGDLQGEGFDLGLTGFGDAERNRLHTNRGHSPPTSVSHLQCESSL